jgi:hypothetical protein
MAYQTRRQVQAKLEKRERFYERMMWVMVAMMSGLGVYCIGVLGL